MRPRAESPPSPNLATGAADAPRAEPDALVREAHRVLLHYMPGASLPEDLSKVRTLLDAHMFGRDKRTHRDDVVEIARQIDQVLRARVR